MLIQCTKKLLDELKIKPVQAKEGNPLFCWHANLITINHRKTVVLMNDSNLYRIILYGLKAKDFNKLDELIVGAIRNTLLEEYIKSDIVEQFINGSRTISYAKTKDRTMVARLNKACEDIYFFTDLMKNDTISQSHTGKIASASLVGNGQHGYMHPNEAFYKDLEDYSGTTIFSCKAVELKIILNLQNHHVWRSVIVL